MCSADARRRPRCGDAEFIPNPLVDVVLRFDDSGQVPEQIEVSAYSVSRGFARAEVPHADRPRYDLVWRFLHRPRDETLAGLDLSPSQIAWLAQAGLVVARTDRGPELVAARPGDAEYGFSAHGHAVLGRCIEPAVAALLADHYRAEIGRGALKRGDRQTDRHRAYNDPAARILQRALLPLAASAVGVPLQSSFTYATSYDGSIALPVHRDRPQCDPVLSLMIDYRPAPIDGGSVPWPLELHIVPDEPPLTLFQAIGEGILFRGCEIRHGRAPLPASGSCIILLLNYVPLTFPGPVG